jgi:ABC-type cobalamin transport system permease subunit
VLVCPLGLVCPDELLCPLCPDELLPVCATASAPPSVSAQIVMRIFFIAFSLDTGVCTLYL